MSLLGIGTKLQWRDVQRWVDGQMAYSAAPGALRRRVLGEWRRAGGGGEGAGVHLGHGVAVAHMYRVTGSAQSTDVGERHGPV